MSRPLPCPLDSTVAGAAAVLGTIVETKRPQVEAGREQIFKQKLLEMGQRKGLSPVDADLGLTHLLNLGLVRTDIVRIGPELLQPDGSLVPVGDQRFVEIILPEASLGDWLTQQNRGVVAGGHDFVETLIGGPDGRELTPREMALLEAHLRQIVPLSTMAQSDYQGRQRKLDLIRTFNRNLQAQARPAAMSTFDVFLSHNSKDKPIVRQLGEALKARGLRVWLDEWELVPGRPWQEALEEIIETAKAAAVLVGPAGLGPWEEPEMRACLSQFVDRRLPVIPVLLPGVPTTPKLPLFLQQFTWVDLRSGLGPEGLARLEWGITGTKPTP